MTKPTKASPEQQFGLSKVAPGIWFVQGDEANRPADSTDPTLIFLFGWMDAKLAHISKYSVAYRAIYPYAHQIVVASTYEVFILPKFVLRRRLQPILPLLTSLGVIGPSTRPHRILTQALSNGGSSQLNYLSQILPKSTPNVVTSAVVLDSTPGGDDWGSATYVFNMTIPNIFLRYPFYVFLVAIQVISFLLGRTTWKIHGPVRNAILKPDWLPWMSWKTTPFLYVYSKADRSVPYRHVQKHTEVAEGKGQDITRLVFDTSGHVEHMRHNPDAYWNAVRELWSKAVAGSK
ncbi:hypothetical protein FS842_003264 [Serendipita sp. 407]|nr:hypothetical protein FS842_003264 [Serendipita sp. 407]